MKRNIVLMLLLSAVCISAFAAGAGESGRTGSQILRFNMSARSAALGGGGMGIINGMSAINMNPAAVSDMEHRGIALSHNELFDDVRVEYLAYSQKLFGVSLAVEARGLYFSMDEVDSSGMFTGESLTIYNTAGTLTAGLKIGENISIGGGATMIYEYYGDEGSSGANWGFNGGIRADILQSRLSVGLSFRNASSSRIGFLMEEDMNFPLPLMYNGGIAYRFKNKQLRDVFILCADVEYYWDREFVPSGGIEYYIKDWFALRAGYRYNEDNDHLDNVTFGFGISEIVKTLSGELDYAYSAYGNMGATHKITYSIEF